jgi:hypothetical protein
MGYKISDMMGIKVKELPDYKIYVLVIDIVQDKYEW